MTSACAPRAPRDLLGDAQHQPPIDDDAHRAGDGEHDLLLDVAERDEIQPRPLLPRRQQPDELARLLRSTRATGWDSCGSARSSTAQPRFIIRCAATGESMPPGQQARDASGGARRQAAGAALLAEEVERLGRQQLDMDR